MATTIIDQKRRIWVFPNRQLQERLDRMGSAQKDALLDFVAVLLGLEEGESFGKPKQKEADQYAG